MEFLRQLFFLPSHCKGRPRASTQPPLSLHASLSSRLCPSVQLWNPPLSLSLFLFPPAGLRSSRTTGQRRVVLEKHSGVRRSLHACTHQSGVETGSVVLTCSLRSALSCAQATAHFAAATEEVYRAVSRKKGQIRKTPRSSQLSLFYDGTSGHRVTVCRKRVFFFTFCNQNCTVPLLLQSWCLWCFSGNISHLKGCDDAVSCSISSTLCRSADAITS